MIVKVHLTGADVEIIDQARRRRSRSEYIGSAAVDRARDERADKGAPEKSAACHAAHIATVDGDVLTLPNRETK